MTTPVTGKYYNDPTLLQLTQKYARPVEGTPVYQPTEVTPSYEPYPDPFTTNGGNNGLSALVTGAEQNENGSFNITQLVNTGYKDGWSNTTTSWVG